MSVTRTPRLDAIRRREEDADRRKTVAVIGAVLALSSFAFVIYVTALVWK